MTRVLLAGDSTVAVCPAAETPMSGWGPHLAAPLNTRVTAARIAAGLPAVAVPVVNTAKGGATTASHRAEGLWDALLAEARAHDTVIIQFGHNDQKLEELPAFGAFQKNLERFVTEVRGVGAYPVLCTPVARRHFDGQRLRATHREYPAAVAVAAESTGVPLIDLSTLTSELYQRLGPVGSTALFTYLPAGASVLYPDGVADDTHFNVTGACAVAEIVAEHVTPVVLAALCARAADRTERTPGGPAR